MKSKKYKLTTKFMLGIWAILFCALIVISILFYEYVRNMYLEETYKNTDIVLGYIDSTVNYVSDDLRPRMLDVLPKDEFISEAMSTSVVSRAIMQRFIDKFPDYVYRRVSLNPMNPDNTADKVEREIIGRFESTHEYTNTWKGTVKRQGRSYFANFKAVLMKEECLLCHGDPARAPSTLLARYGSEHGHNWKVGSVVGVESIAVPVDQTFYRIRQVSIFIFVLGLIGMCILFVVFNYFNYLIAVRPLRQAIAFFKSVAEGQSGLDARFDVKGRDEISELGEAFNHMIAHLRRSQAELRESQSKYKSLFDGSKDGILITDCEGFILDINNAGVSLFECKDKQEFMKHISIHDFFLDAASRNDFIGSMERDGYLKDFETMFYQTTGNVIDVLITATRRLQEKGGICRCEYIIKDITSWKKMKLQVRHAEKLASIGQLAAGVAHEINNPLSIVLGYTNLMLKDIDSDRHREDLQIIASNAKVCKKIVEDLLNFSRQGKPEFVKTDILEALELVLVPVEKDFLKSGVKIVRDYQRSMPLIRMDTGKIQQVFLNLLMNALQSIEAEGTITVAVRLNEAGKNAVISFADTGCGIPQGLQPRIFEPFFSTKPPGQGTGLGTAVSYGIIREHGGNISFESSEGKGSVFRVEIPVDVEVA